MAKTLIRAVYTYINNISGHMHTLGLYHPFPYIHHPFFFSLYLLRSSGSQSNQVEAARRGNSIFGSEGIGQLSSTERSSGARGHAARKARAALPLCEANPTVAGTEPSLTLPKGAGACAITYSTSCGNLTRSCTRGFGAGVLCTVFNGIELLQRDVSIRWARTRRACENATDSLRSCVY